MKRNIMQNILLSVLLVFGLISCDEAPKTETDASSENGIKETFDQRMEREITAALEIPATERYTLKIYRSFINNDTIEDAIITINRKQYAEDLAIQNKNAAKMEDFGFSGNYNFFFYYNGSLDKLSVPIPVPSSAGYPLKVMFEPITQSIQNDVIISYRVRNSGFKSYFSAVDDQQLLRVFNWVEFDQVGTPNESSICHKYEKSEDGLTKEIVLYESKILNRPKDTIGWHFEFEPELKCSNVRIARFFFNPRSLKYAASKEDVARLKAKYKSI